ncbi:MAG TPA: GNAT family N-acetyltransferase [Terriglobales bacterium]|nr:GNAT family N-acetyltransferase [Terriglobales bacterium]
MLRIFQADLPDHIAAVRDLFLEYAQSLSFSLGFQNFEDELATLPGKYVPPLGRLYLADQDGFYAGCVALRPLEDLTCEMKRLYVRPDYRRKGVGQVLAEIAIQEARRIGYRRLRLDSIEHEMREAVALYQWFGFRQIEPYTSNPVPGAIFMELDLQQARLNI